MSEENQRIYQDNVLETLKGIRKGLENPPSEIKGLSEALEKAQQPPEVKEVVHHHPVLPWDLAKGKCSTPGCEVELEPFAPGVKYDIPKTTCPGCKMPDSPESDKCWNCGSTEGVLE